jgi:hypothetical protein
MMGRNFGALGSRRVFRGRGGGEGVRGPLGGQSEFHLGGSHGPGLGECGREGAPLRLAGGGDVVAVPVGGRISQFQKVCIIPGFEPSTSCILSCIPYQCATSVNPLVSISDSTLYKSIILPMGTFTCMLGIVWLTLCHTCHKIRLLV